MDTWNISGPETRRRQTHSILVTVWHPPGAQYSEFLSSFASPLPQSYHDALEIMDKKENPTVLSRDVCLEEARFSLLPWQISSRVHPFFLAFWSCQTAFRILVPDQGSSLCPLQWKHRVLTTGSPGKSPG